MSGGVSGVTKCSVFTCLGGDWGHPVFTVYRSGGVSGVTKCSLFTCLVG